MKKSKMISNIFWAISLMIMILVILQNFHVINILPTTTNFFGTTTPENLKLSDYYTWWINGTAYAFLGVSIMIKICAVAFKKDPNNDERMPSVKNHYLKAILVVVKIGLIILTLLTLALSLLITLLSLIDFSNVPL